MRKLIMAVNISLDGYADHTVGVAADDELHDFFSDLLSDSGAELFGRITYEMMESYWPHVHKDPKASKSDLEFAHKLRSIPKFVFSSTLDKVGWENTTLVSTSAFEYVAKLKQTQGKDLLVGGINLAGSLMSHGLVDEYWILIHPVVVGQGRHISERVNEMLKLRLIESRVLNSGVVALHYASDRG
jgi:dihydrofolate reductase